MEPEEEALPLRACSIPCKFWEAPTTLRECFRALRSQASLWPPHSKKLRGEDDGQHKSQGKLRLQKHPLELAAPRFGSACQGVSED